MTTEHCPKCTARLEHIELIPVRRNIPADEEFEATWCPACERIEPFPPPEG